MKKVLISTFFIFGALLVTGIVTLRTGTIKIVDLGPTQIGSLFKEEPERAVSLLIRKERTFARITDSFGIPYANMLKILKAAEGVYSLEKIVEGHELSFIFDEPVGDIKKIVYQINNDDALILKRASDDSWLAERVSIPYQTELEEINGVIESSLFETITEAGGDERVALALAEIFAWQIDFAVDIRNGDKFKLIYEKRFLEGNYVRPGKILAAEFINDGVSFKGIYFKDGSGQEGHYDENGLSLQKIFLKSPLSYKYVSSGFSYNRLNPVTRSNFGPHRAIDYAADHGTPVVTVGDGTVVSSGWNGGLGKAVFIRHNDTYTTVYAHLSRTAVGRGSRVKQGQVIGYVGATGQTTGPHLHFELRKNGGRRNPLTIELPPGDPVVEEYKVEFEKILSEYKLFFGGE